MMRATSLVPRLAAIVAFAAACNSDPDPLDGTAWVSTNLTGASAAPGTISSQRFQMNFHGGSTRPRAWTATWTVVFAPTSGTYPGCTQTWLGAGYTYTDNAETNPSGPLEFIVTGDGTGSTIARTGCTNARDNLAAVPSLAGDNASGIETFVLNSGTATATGTSGIPGSQTGTFSQATLDSTP